MLIEVSGRPCHRGRYVQEEIGEEFLVLPFKAADCIDDAVHPLQFCDLAMNFFRVIQVQCPLISIFHQRRRMLLECITVELFIIESRVEFLVLQNAGHDIKSVCLFLRRARFRMRWLIQSEFTELHFELWRQCFDDWRWFEEGGREKRCITPLVNSSLGESYILSVFLAA